MAEVNGTGHGSDPTELDTNNILRALEVIHNPSTKNYVRGQAIAYLEKLKDSEHALQQGYLLGRDQTQPPLVRHYGLSLLENVVKVQALHFTHEQNEQLRQCIIQLGLSISANDQPFIRNKIAGTWVELAKRSWMLDWYDLDEHLVNIWTGDVVQKDFVLSVLENLSDDVFVRDDITAVFRGKELNSALVEIFTSKQNYSGGLKIGDVTHHMRFGDQGWLIRITQFLESQLSQNQQSQEQTSTVIKALATLRSALSWVMSPAIVTAKSLQYVCSCLTHADPDVIVAAADTLITLYGRQKFELIEVQGLVYPLCQADSVATLLRVYSWSVVGPDEIESPKYLISKKISELVALLSENMIRFAPPKPDALDLSAFLQFVIRIGEHDSLIVSIPAMHSWAKLLETSGWRRSQAVASCVGPLLQAVSKRLVQYDQLPDDTEEPAVVFVNDEIEIFPERQGFYLNYRKLCSSVIEWICYTHLEQAMNFTLSQVDIALTEIEQSQGRLNKTNYQRISEQVLRADSQFAIVDAAFRGLERWQNAHKEQNSADEQQLKQRMAMQSKQWATEMITKRDFHDPQIKQRQLKTAVEISSRALQNDTAFAFSVLEHILSAFIPVETQFPLYSEAVADLHGYATTELRRLALYHADYFATFYDQLQNRFSTIVSQVGVDAKIQVDLSSILFLIVQRASSVDAGQQKERLWSFLQPISNAWNDSSTQATLSSFESFVESQAFDQVGPFMRSMQAATIEDWSTVQNTDIGTAIQRRMNDGYLSLPLRETRVLLSISTEKLEQDSSMHKLICELWSPMIAPILRSVLQLTTYNHQLHDPSSWPNVVESDEPTIRRILRDRYWQSGISEGSMNEFHTRVKSSKNSLEGFASSVRGRIRTNLEQCYSIIHTLGRLGSSFYSLDQVPDMIAEALLATTGPLSSHHFSVMLLMLPKLIEECPSDLRDHFLTPVLSTLLSQMDQKLTAEWQKLDQKKQIKHDEEDLNDEMRDDSVLRQTSYKAVNMVSFWLDPKREEQLQTKKSIVNGAHLTQSQAQPMKDFILSNVRILEPLLMFVTHALTYRDTKACQIMISTAQRIIPAYVNDQYLQAEPAASVREYVSSDMLKAAITSLNDGYYADYQQYYAQLIALIWLSYGLPTHIPATETQAAYERPPLTQTPTNILLSLPGMDAAKVESAARSLARESANPRSRKLRAIILSLLEDVRGVRISELGKIDTRQQQSRILEKYKEREEMMGMQGMADDSTAGRRKLGNDDDDNAVDLGGVADMFGNG